MSLLLIERGPRHPLSNTEISMVARTSTLTVLPGLDGVRRGSVVQFLYESGLISNDSAIVDLSGAGLRKADLSGANLSDVKLSETNLSGAMLNDADLSRANLNNAYLSGASLIGASLGDAYLGEANLREAYMSGAYMGGSYMEDAKGITNEQLEQQAYSLEGATMPNCLKYEDWLKNKKDHGEYRKNSEPS